MSALTLKDLLEAGAHFGHQTKRWNPKMKRFILCPRKGIYIIDLNKTLTCLDKFLDRVTKEVENGGKVLFVGTKKQIKECIEEHAIRCKMPYVTERWLGGMLTNFKTIRQSIGKLEKIEAMEADGTVEALPKKEVLKLMKKKEKLVAILNGIRNLKRPPALIFIVDTLKEHIGVKEAHCLKIPIGAIVDTNSDPDNITFPIPANDDAIKSVELITRVIADTILAASTNVVYKSEEDIAVKDIEDKDSILFDDDEEKESEDSSVRSTERPKRRRVVKKKVVKEPEEV